MRILRFFPITCYYSDKTIPFVLTDIRFRIFLKKLWNFFITYVTIISVAQAWRNWQTRTVQVRVLARAWRFKSSCLHHIATDYVAFKIPVSSHIRVFFICPQTSFLYKTLLYFYIDWQSYRWISPRNCWSWRACLASSSAASLKKDWSSSSFSSRV